MITLTKESFEKKELAEQKGGLYEYYQYSEDNKKIVLRFYGTTVGLAVDYYVGIDLEDSDSVITVENEEDAWEKALVIANRFFKLYEFKGNK